MKYVKDEEKKLILDKFIVDVDLKDGNRQKEIDCLVDNMDTLFTLSQQWKLGNKYLWTALGAAIGVNEALFQDLYAYVVKREQEKNVSGTTLSGILKAIRALLTVDSKADALGGSIGLLVKNYAEDIINRLEIEDQVTLIRKVGYQESRKARQGLPSDRDAGYKLAKKMQHDQEERKNRRHNSR